MPRRDSVRRIGGGRCSGDRGRRVRGRRRVGDVADIRRAVDRPESGAGGRRGLDLRKAVERTRGRVRAARVFGRDGHLCRTRRVGGRRRERRRGDGGGRAAGGDPRQSRANEGGDADATGTARVRGEAPGAPARPLRAQVGRAETESASDQSRDEAAGATARAVRAAPRRGKKAETRRARRGRGDEAPGGDPGPIRAEDLRRRSGAAADGRGGLVAGRGVADVGNVVRGVVRGHRRL
mmetsp:Transcript_3185/g.9735  ORF Transcript_3185/g.9735 Transcript_3185/m.9735 type:complete len:237 (-) Transcript_3185:637-1347(-)